MRTVFTEDAVETIRRMVNLNLPKEDIAEAIGTSVSSLKVSCSRMGISLVPGQPDREPKPPTDNTKKPLRLYFEDHELEKLRNAASRRGTSATNLIYTIIATVLNEGLMNAVLDDER